ncbi:MAG TPA: hypothetical protein VF834_08860 [Streptosporangiaceae bacterium]
MTAQRTRVPVGISAMAIFLISVPALFLRRARKPAIRLPGVLRFRLPVPRLRRIRLATAWAVLAWAVGACTLFVVYLQVSRTSAVTSDGASNALQAWDMLHGNLLLRGWQVSDVSFYTTELPQYMLIEHWRGLTPDVVHIASAMTYTLIALLAGMLAKGRATGREAVLRVMLAVGIMLAPQPGNAIYVLMGSPDHMGSTVPVLLAFLLLDRAPRRWYVPVAAGLVLCWGLIADGIVLFTGIGPVVAVAAIRAYQSRFRLGQRWLASWFELELAATAAGAIWLARTALREIAAHGGFTVWPISTALTSAGDFPHYLTITSQGLLLLFGAYFFSMTVSFAAALAMTHLAGLGLAAWGGCSAIRRFSRADLGAQLLAAGIALTLAAYLLGTRAYDLLSTRDITALLPFGAALAGRMLAGRLASARLVPALAVVLVAYLISLGEVVVRPAAPQPTARLAAWLSAHHLSYGLCDYWDANVTTLMTGGRVRLRSVSANGMQVSRGSWEESASWYDPVRNAANFLVLAPDQPGSSFHTTVASVRRRFGQPVRIYELGTSTILVWNQNLLTALAPAARP